MTVTTISVLDVFDFSGNKKNTKLKRLIAEVAEDSPTYVELLGFDGNNKCVFHATVPSSFIDLASKVSQEIRWQHEAKNGNS